MTRKNLIIVTLLVNAGLMIIFFISALKSGSGDEAEFATTDFPKSDSSEIKIVQGAQVAPADEIDQILKEHGSSVVSVQMPAIPSTPVMPSSPPLTLTQGTASFADDLKAISTSDAMTTPVAPHATFSSVSDTQSSQMAEVRVKKGDVLEKIARQNGVSVDALMKANGLSSSRLKIGQVLKIPGKSSVRQTHEQPVHASAPVTTAAAAPSSGEGQYYTVKNGDNPWTIAVKNHMKVEDLLKLNDLNEERARRLKPGDKLRIR